MNLQAEAELSFDQIAGFIALTGREPFRWQRRLLEEYLATGHTPNAVDVPTGLGKTMVMALWIVARAYGSPLPRRLVYVVDRRAVVDQATEEAKKLRAALEGEAEHFGALDEAARTRARLAVAETKKRLGLSYKRQLPISTLRGQHADNLEWLKDPHLPAIIVGTVDMIGSRLLFEGYGVSRRMRPMHAGLLGADSWILLDEAHLVPPFEGLLRSVAVFNSVAPVPGFRATALSATGRNAVGLAFALEERDIQGDERTFKRLTASKKLTLREAPKDELAKAMASCAIEMAKGANRRIIVFANSRKTAQAISRLIENGAPNASAPVLLVGARRVRERELLQSNDVFKRFSPQAETKPDAAFLVATSAGEVGVDLDADGLVCDLAPWERMVQRLGRVNRRAEPGEAPVVVFDAIEDDAEDAVENSAEARKAAKTAADTITAAMRELLTSDSWPASEDGAREASPLALRRLKEAAAGDPALRAMLDRATTPEPLRPALAPALLDAWAMTSLEVHTGRPIVEPWLRGWVDKEPQTRVLWRNVLPPTIPGDRAATKGRLNDFFDAAPPHLTEVLETYSYEVANVANRRAAEASANLSPTDTAAVVLDPAGAVQTYATFKWLLKRPLAVPGLVGRTIVFNARLGGLDANGLLDPKADHAPTVLDGAAGSWTPDAEDTGFRVRVASRGADSERGWRVEFRCAATASDEDEDGDEIRVEVYRGRSDVVGDLAIGRKAQTLDAHSDMIVEQAREIARKVALAPDLGKTLEIAARLHDLGKKRALWQRAMNAPGNGMIYAKTEGGGNPRLLRLGEEVYRHEFGSLRDADTDIELNALSPELRDLALHLVAAHHGFGRPFIAAVDPDEPPLQSAARAPDVAWRYARLQKRWGWWGLAWWESLIRAADWAASAQNDAAACDDG
jgi:CRISPR-associated endonuclease/helicase Cas3